MGLDMYAWRVKSEDAIDNFTVAAEEDGSDSKLEELFYWRKHHDLHGWMERLYRSKGGVQEFNCQKVRLTYEDLCALEQAVMLNQLPQTTGFFFGTNPPDEASMARDMEFISRAKAALAMGDQVYYDSWW